MRSAAMITVRFAGTEGAPARSVDHPQVADAAHRVCAVDHGPFVVVAAHGDGGDGVPEGGDLLIDGALEARVVVDLIAGHHLAFRRNPIVRQGRIRP
jgi:hypothetical protein